MSSLAGQGLTDVGKVDGAVLGFRAGRDALTQDHPRNVQDLHDTGLAQCLVPGTHDAAMHPCLLEDLAEACFVWRFVRFHVTARVDPDTVFAVIDQQDAVISQDKTRRGEMFGQQPRPGRQQFRHDESFGDAGRHTSSQILATMSWVALGLPRRLRLPDISAPLLVNMSSSAARRSCLASSAVYAASCCVRNRAFTVSCPGRGWKMTSGMPTAAASASVTPPALLTSRSAACRDGVPGRTSDGEAVYLTQDISVVAAESHDGDGFSKGPGRQRVTRLEDVPEAQSASCDDGQMGILWNTQYGTGFLPRTVDGERRTDGNAEGVDGLAEAPVGSLEGRRDLLVCRDVPVDPLGHVQCLQDVVGKAVDQRRPLQAVLFDF